MGPPRTVLETRRLLLRELEPADAAALVRVLCDRDNMRFFPLLYKPHDALAWIERSRWRYASQGAGLWAVIRKDDGDLIGDCGIIVQHTDRGDEREIGYHLRRDAQGRGFATEAARACFAYGFGRLGLDRLISLIRPENVPSRRVAERNGLRPDRIVLHAGLPHLVYQVDRAEWRYGFRE